MTANRAHLFWELPLGGTGADPLIVAAALSAKVAPRGVLLRMSLHLWGSTSAGSIQIHSAGLPVAVLRTEVDRVLEALEGGPARLSGTAQSWDLYIGHAGFHGYEVAVFAVISGFSKERFEMLPPDSPQGPIRVSRPFAVTCDGGRIA